ncbi:MAG TPA: penicillin-binding protein activator LpoB [Planctomycetota bacterium]|nr:penicillin-binding protein activator LpoB [Planctomycetota bacterium]
MKSALSFFVVLPLVALTACSSVQYDDPDKVETLTIDFGSTDLQTMASDMVTSLNTAPGLAYLDKPGADKRIIMYVGAVNNRTSEHIDTQGITDAIRVSLQQGGRFRFVAGEQAQAEIGDQVRFQQGSGRVDPTQARAFGKQVGAEVVLTGTLRSIEKTKGRSIESGGAKKEDVYYQFVLECVNIDTGEIIWSNIKEVRKTQSRSVFG